MNTRVRILALMAGLLCSAQASAVPVIMTAGANNRLEVSFTVVSQPADHLTIWFYPASVTAFGSVDARTQLFDEAGLLGTGRTPDFNARAAFTDPSSYFAEQGATVIDFGRIADGVSGGLFVFQIVAATPGASLQFDTDDFRAETFGNSGGFPPFYPTITNIAVIAAVPEQGTTALLTIGLAALGLARHRRSSAPTH